MFDSNLIAAQGMLIALLIGLAVTAAFVIPFAFWLETRGRRHRRARLETIHDDLRHYEGTLRLH